MTAENIIHCVQDIHVKELVKRLHWSVKIRWYYLILSSLLIALVYLLMDQQSIHLHYRYLLTANVFLFFCNLIFQSQLSNSDRRCLGISDLRFYFILQIISDYLALTLIVYALGSIETPLMLMVIPNTILASLFFTPRQSLLIALAGLLLLISPLLLEYFQLLPVISIFNTPAGSAFKQNIFSQPVILFGYILMLFVCVIFCWYLLCSITSRLIQNELELECSYKNMLKLDKEKTQATLRSTHELKAPLAAIKNYVYVIQGGYAGEVNDKLLQIIERIGKRCDYLLNNVTDIIKLGNLKSYIVLEKDSKQFYPINLRSYMLELIKQNRASGTARNITLQFHDQLADVTTENNYLIMANKENLQLIFSNLLSNAINYSYENGIVDIILEKNTAGRLCVSINDQGIGIAEKHREKVFEEHFRSNNAVQFYQGGSGLGLSIVKVCADILNADVLLESSQEQGTQVSICFDSYFKPEFNNGGEKHDQNNDY